MAVLLIIVALSFCGVSVYCFLKANYCACHRAGQCDNPINLYWISAMLCALTSLLCCCLALPTMQATLLWSALMASCFTGAFISAKGQVQKGKLKQRCNGVKPLGQENQPS